MNPLFILFEIIRACFYPLRIIWTCILYPPYIKLKKEKTLKKYNTIPVHQHLPNAETLHLYIPGRDGFTFNEEPCFLANLNTSHNIEVLPPPCYRHVYLPFSLDNWADSINKRIEMFYRDHRNGKVFVWGYSMGGLAAGVAYKKTASPQTKFILINSPASLISLFANISELDIGLLAIHLIPAAIVLLVIGLQHHQLTLISAVIGAIAVTALLGCITFLHKDEIYFQFAYKMNCRCLRSLLSTPQSLRCFITSSPYIPYRSILFNIVAFIPTCIMKIIAICFLILHYIIYALVYTVVKTLHLVAHLFSTILLWLMNSHHSIHKRQLFSSSNNHEPLLKNLFILQSTTDTIVPNACRASTAFKQKAHADIRHINHNGHDFQSDEYISTCRNIIGV